MLSSEQGFAVVWGSTETDLEAAEVPDGQLPTSSKADTLSREVEVVDMKMFITLNISSLNSQLYTIPHSSTAGFNLANHLFFIVLGNLGGRDWLVERELAAVVSVVLNMEAN